MIDIKLPVYFVLILLVNFQLYQGQKVDQTLDPNVNGADVVDAVIKKVASSKLFPDDHEFLSRIAYVETNNGESPSTYARGSTGGIWNVDDDALYTTQDTDSYPKLTMIHYKIAATFGIHWPSVTTNDLAKPMYSGLAARLFFNTTVAKIPTTIAEQAKLWSNTYHQDQPAPQDKFVNEIAQLHNNFNCTVPFDLCYILDGSGSISSSSFKLARNFVHDTIKSIHSEKAQFCLVLYDHLNYTKIQLDKNPNLAAMLAEIQGLKQPGGGTSTGYAIFEGVRQFNLVKKRPGVPQQMMVITDGQSNGGPPVAQGAAKAKEYGVRMLAFGVGNGVNDKELLQIANNEPGYVDKLDGYVQLDESSYKFVKQSCEMGMWPDTNTLFVDYVKRPEKRYFGYKISNNGLTVVISQLSGQVVAYFAYNVTTPSKAWNDGQINIGATVHIPWQQSNHVFITVESKGPGVNEYSVTAY